MRRISHRLIALGSVALLAASVSGAGAVMAQPSISRGEQKFNIPYQECMNRATGAFRNNGWVNIGSGGAFVQAFRGAEAAYITCNEVNGLTLVNVFVASNSQNASVPGAARVQLQQAMNASGPPPPMSGNLAVDGLGGGRLRIRWQGLQNRPQGWVSVVPRGTPDTVFSGPNIQWAWATTSSGEASWDTSFAPGAYEARYYADNESSRIVVSRYAFNL